MIKNIIFDFGAVLIPLDEPKTWSSFRELGALDSLKDQKELFRKYETGKVETADFLKQIQPHFFRKKIFRKIFVEKYFSKSMVGPTRR